MWPASQAAKWSEGYAWGFGRERLNYYSSFHWGWWASVVSLTCFFSLQPSRFSRGKGGRWLLKFRTHHLQTKQTAHTEPSNEALLCFSGLFFPRRKLNSNIKDWRFLSELSEGCHCTASSTDPHHHHQLLSLLELSGRHLRQLLTVLLYLSWSHETTWVPC